MAFHGVNFFSAVLITSKNPERLAKFYKEILMFPIKDEQHGETEKHYGCELGDLHFAIHPMENFGENNNLVGSVKMAFEVFDIQGFVEHLSSQGIQPLYPPKQMGPMLITALKDPDGNLLEFTQLGERWMKRLKNRRHKGQDLVTQWEVTNKKQIEINPN